MTYLLIQERNSESEHRQNKAKYNDIEYYTLIHLKSDLFFFYNRDFCSSVNISSYAYNLKDWFWFKMYHFQTWLCKAEHD